MDRYHEQLTSAYKSGLHGFYSILSIFLAFLCLVTIFNVPVAGIIFGGLAVLCYFLKRREFVEFEYSFTSGEIDIDKIIEAKRRKKVINFDINEIIMMAPVGSTFLDGTPKGKKIIAYPKNTKERIFEIVLNKNGEVKDIYFIPDDEFVTLCFRSNPRSVKKKDFV
ncbi:MAG: DUF6106 family protein [Clostridiales bacterium]|nr:DUF6106 family protein [Clostridiales bacterium]HBM79426.1 hypothetical protein [Clostridiaceae bacterium]